MSQFCTVVDISDSRSHYSTAHSSHFLSIFSVVNVSAWRSVNDELAMWSHHMMPFRTLFFEKENSPVEKYFSQLEAVQVTDANTGGVSDPLRCRKHTFSSPSHSPASQVAAHDWIRTDSGFGKCQVCHKKIKTLAGRRCVWCHELVRMAILAPWSSARVPFAESCPFF